MDTTQLVLRVQNGDEQALNELYYNCYKLPYSSALTLTKNEADSYEIMQDSFRDVFSRIDLIEDKSAFSKALNSIFVCKCRDYLSIRNNTVFSRESTLASGDYDLSVSKRKDFSPEKNVDYSEAKKAVLEILDSISADQRLLVLAHYALNMSTAELAEALKADEKVITGSLSKGEKDLLGQAELLSKNGVLKSVASDRFIPFLVWMLNEAAKSAPVHQMDQAVKEAALSNTPHTIAADFDDVPSTEEIEPKNDGKVLQNRAEPVEYKAEKANLSSEGTQHSDDESPMDIHDGFTTTEDEYIADEENKKQPSKHTARIIIIAVAAVVAMILGALAFIAFALPNITGESNPVSEMFTGKKEPDFTPEKLVAKYEEAFNAGDRDAIAKLYLPDQSLKRNIEGGAYEMVQKLSDYLLGEKVTIKCELKDDLKYEGDTATGTVKISIDLPDINGQDVGFIVNLLGIETEKEKPVTFERYTDGNWYFKEF